MTQPRHFDPKPNSGASQAPYNFVPLPQKVLKAATANEGSPPWDHDGPPWESHDRWLPGTHSGYFDVTIEALTPVCIGAERSEGSGPGIVESSTTPSGHPTIPGSSLRGMLRNLAEILSFAKLAPVDERRPFFRTFARDSLGDAYRERIAKPHKPRGGFLHLEDGHTTAEIEPARVLRVEHTTLKGIATSFKYEKGPSYTPSQSLQHRACWIRCGSKENAVIDEILLEQPTSDGNRGWEEATLVLTGSAPKKKHEFVLLPVEGDPIPVPEKVLERFHDPDQQTQWQQKAFPADQPKNGGRRESNGALRDGEPVFYVLDDDDKRVRFLGRARHFRLPYDKSPAEMLPEEHRDESLIDCAEALFGRVSDRGSDRGAPAAIRGRIRVEDAVCNEPADKALGKPVTALLSSPKPTAFQHYLTQDGREGKRELTAYLEGHATTLRGHKLYWHRWDDKQGHANLDAGEVPEADTQHTKFRPVCQGAVFRGRVWFDNLTDFELGLLNATLNLPEGCAHKLGMGKPIGASSVRVAATPTLIDREARYKSWDSGVHTDEHTHRAAKEVFEQKIIDHARKSGENPQAEHLGDIPRLAALFHMLAWDKRPPRGDTGYLKLQGFSDRPVLPSPHQVAGDTNPPLPGAAPTVSGQATTQQRGTQKQPSRSQQPQSKRPQGDQSEGRNDDASPADADSGSETVVATVLPKQTKSGRPKASYPGCQEAVVLDAPQGLAAGDRFVFDVHYEGKGAGNATQIRYKARADSA